MSAGLGFAPLLAALRESKLSVGVPELTRLRQVFALGPQLGGHGDPEGRRLKALLRAVLVKSPEDRALFDLAFEAWLGRADQELSLREVTASETKRVEVPLLTASPLRPHFWRVLAAVVLLLWSLALGDHGKAPRQQPPTTKTTQPALLSTTPTSTPANIPQHDFTTKSAKPNQPARFPASTPATLTPDEIRKRRLKARVPIPSVTLGEQVWKGRPALSLGVLALLAASGLWLALRRRSWLPELMPEPVKKGPPRVFLTPPQLAGPQLLEPREEEDLVWGIGHFVADEPTRRLDLPATVRETARAGGIPHLRFHQARYPRKVWLWIDEAADDPALLRLADEVEAALRTHSLPVERALFRGVPDWLVNSAGKVFAPNEVDERRDTALAAILTDGRILARQYAADDRRVYLDALLRSLSHWPRLALVDFSASPGDLAAILMKHSILRIPPAGLATFLGSDDMAKRKPVTRGPDDAVWAAACALSPSSVDEARSFEIRRRLGLVTSPWAFRALRAEAPGPAGRLQWQPEIRARRVNWLREAEAQSQTGVAPGSLLGKALDFWEEAYDQELKDRKKRDTEGPWLETPAHQHLAMERALLALWRDAPNAVRALYRLHGGALREVIKRQLRDLAPADWGGAERVLLTWTWAERSSAERIMLQQMGLGGGMPTATLRRPGRLWLGLGLCLGLAIGALGTASLNWLRSLNRIEFIHISPSTFTMGSGHDPLADRGEKPAHEVTLSEFWIGKTEVSNAQYRADHPEREGPNTFPVTEISWFEAKDFCERHGWRLPTEAEWEYAARAGTQTPWSSGADEKRLREFSWFRENSESDLHPVGTKRPNPWGIYDMHGNVWEWVADWYGPYKLGPQKDPKGPEIGEGRSVRGGAFFDLAEDLRSASRKWYPPSIQYGNVGFRCAHGPRRQR